MATLLVSFGDNLLAKIDLCSYHQATNSQQWNARTHGVEHRHFQTTLQGSQMM